LTEPAKLFILQLLLENPGITLHEVQEQLLQILLIQIDIALHVHTAEWFYQIKASDHSFATE